MGCKLRRRKRRNDKDEDNDEDEDEVAFKRWLKVIFYHHSRTLFLRIITQKKLKIFHEGNSLNFCLQHFTLMMILIIIKIIKK